jgi:hypothetical protein
MGVTFMLHSCDRSMTWKQNREKYSSAKQTMVESHSRSGSMGSTPRLAPPFGPESIG